jgi:hypothetical protein
MIIMTRDTTTTTSDADSFDQDDTPRRSEPLSPPGGAESLFLAGLTTAQLSQEALFTSLQQLSTSSSSTPLPFKFPSSVRSISAASVRSAMTEDFQSCADFSTDNTDLLFGPSSFDDEADIAATTPTASRDVDDNSDADTAFFSFFTPIKQQLQARSSSTSHSSSTMPSKKKSRSSMETESTVPPTPTTTVPEEEGIDMDVAELVYGKAKNVWAWGKSLPLISIGLGLTEAVAQKAASMAGTDLEKLDKDIIQPRLVTLDSEFIAPVLKAVMDYTRPIIIKVLSPFGLIKNEAENPELTAVTATH